MGKLIFILFLCANFLFGNSIGLMPLLSESDSGSLKYFPMLTKKIERSLENYSVKLLKNVETLKIPVLEDLLFIENLESLLLYKIQSNQITFFRYQGSHAIEDISKDNPTDLKEWIYNAKLDLKIPSHTTPHTPFPQKKEETINTPWYNKKVVWLVGSIMLASVVSGVILFGQGQNNTNAQLEYK